MKPSPIKAIFIVGERERERERSILFNTTNHHKIMAVPNRRQPGVHIISFNNNQLLCMPHISVLKTIYWAASVYSVCVLAQIFVR